MPPAVNGGLALKELAMTRAVCIADPQPGRIDHMPLGTLQVDRLGKDRIAEPLGVGALRRNAVVTPNAGCTMLNSS